MRSGGIRFTLWIVLMLSAPAAFAGGVREGAGGLKDPNSLTGLCTTRDKSKPWVAKGWCKSMRESLENGKGGCAKNTFEKLRSRAQQGGIKDMQKYCPNISELASDANHFASFLTQVMAALTIEESDWTEKPRGSPYGLMQLDVPSVKQKAYSCGCGGIKSKRDLFDGQKNVQCGSYIAMHWMLKDGTMGSGSGGKSRGIARYFQPFREIDRKKRARIQKKLSNYCQQRSKGEIDLPAEGAATTK